MLYLGRWVENRLNEFEKNGKPKHRLKDLLADQEAETDIRAAIGMLRQFRGAVRVRKSKAKAATEADAEG